MQLALEYRNNKIREKFFQNYVGDGTLTLNKCYLFISLVGKDTIY